MYTPPLIRDRHLPRPLGVRSVFVQPLFFCFYFSCLLLSSGVVSYNFLLSKSLVCVYFVVFRPLVRKIYSSYSQHCSFLLFFPVCCAKFPIIILDVLFYLGICNFFRENRKKLRKQGQPGKKGSGQRRVGWRRRQSGWLNWI